MRIAPKDINPKIVELLRIKAGKEYQSKVIIRQATAEECVRYGIEQSAASMEG